MHGFSTCYALRGGDRTALRVECFGEDRTSVNSYFSTVFYFTQTFHPPLVIFHRSCLRGSKNKVLCASQEKKAPILCVAMAWPSQL
jgi:hypothetical protein